MPDTQTVRGYELKDLLGQGGFGAVYRAYQPIVKRDVAIKIILPEYANDPTFIRTFEAEAQTIASLEHLNIIPLYDFWREPGKAFLVMRLLKGGSLHELLKEQDLSPELLVRLIDQLASALAHAHRHGIIHRDFKPANVLLDEDQNAYLSDFGLAISVKQDSDAPNEVSGTPRYMAPEQISGETLSPQTDLYALGIMLYEILTGKHPFGGTVSELLLGHLNNPLPPIQEFKPDLPIELNMVLQKATEKNPQQRYADARALALAFKQAYIAFQSPSLPQASSQFGATSTRTGLVNPMMYSFDIELAVENPYKGLRAFAENDAADFFGRETLIDRLLDHLAAERFMAVIGPSGSGKSSVVKAGVLPQIRQGELPNSKNWFIVDFVPGANPLEKLHSALLGIATQTLNLDMKLRENEQALQEVIHSLLPKNDSSEILLVIDQFEEVFTQVDNERERSLFLESLRLALADPQSRLRVIVTLRADFYDRPLLYPNFGELVRQNTQVVLPLSAEELERAIVAPAERVGLEVEAALVAAIVSDVSAEPGALPLLQYALTELFEKRNDKTLTLEAYRANGGVLGALARRAEELYQGLDPLQQEMSRQLFLRLVTPGEGSEDTRRRMRWSEMAAIDAGSHIMESVINIYGKYRLLTFDNDAQTREPTIEVAHEAIIRQWQRLRNWLDDSRHDLRTQRMLSAAANDWINSGRDASFLLRGTRLHQFEEWFANTGIAVTQQERDYLDASLAERRRQEAEDAEQAAYQKHLEERARRRMQWTIAAMAVGLIAAIVLSALAINQRAKAQDNAEQAEAEALRSTSLRYGAEANTLLESKSNNELAALLAIHGLDLTYSPQADAVLSELADLDFPLLEMSGHNSEVYSLDLNRDNTILLSTSLDGTLRYWNVETGEEIRHTEESPENHIWQAEFSPDNSQLLVDSSEGYIALRDTETGEEIHRWLPDEEDDFNVPKFSSDGRWIGVGTSFGEVWLIDATTYEITQTFSQHEGTIESLAFSTDGNSLVAGDDLGKIIVWDISSGAIVMESDDPSQWIFDLQFSPDNQSILTAGFDGIARLWDVQTGREIHRFVGHVGPVWSIAMSPAGDYVLTGGEDFTARLWDASTEQEVRRLTGHTSTVRDVLFSPEEDYMFTAGLDGQIKEWAFQAELPTSQYSGHNDIIYDLAVSPDGQHVFTGSWDSTIREWDIETGETVHVFEGQTGVINGVSISPDGKTLLSSAGDWTAYLWDIETGEQIQHIGNEELFMATSEFSPDGRYVLTGNSDNAAHLWDVQTGEEVRRYGDHDDEVWGVAFSADGSQIATTSYDQSTRVWDTETGELLHILEGHEGGVWDAAFSPDGKTLATAADDTAIILWDLESEQEIRRYEGHTASANSVIFSADGKLLLTSSSDGTVRLWDVQTGEEVRRISGHLGAVNIARFSVDENYIFSGSSDKTLRRWYVHLDDLVDFVCSRLIRDFTDEERRRYGIEGNTATCPAR